MAITHGGGRAKRFEWKCTNDFIDILNEHGKSHRYSIKEIKRALSNLNKRFGMGWFPLANNVEKLHNGNEIPGFGMALYSIVENTTYAQGSSYLGIVLEELRILEWNGKSRGIDEPCSRNQVLVTKPSRASLKEQKLQPH